MPRPPGQKPAVTGVFLLALLLLSKFPIIALAQQQHASLQHEYHSAKPSGSDSWIETTPESDKRASLGKTPHHQHQNRNEHVNAVIHPDDVRALATLAPAGRQIPGDAVRAPPALRKAQSSSGKGLYARLPERNLQDWEVEDLVLLATVDGIIHARDRKTGEEIWDLRVDAPMVETTYYSPAGSVNVLGAAQHWNYLWIIEPSQDGMIYIYDPSSPYGLQKLGLTVKQLVDDFSTWQSDEHGVTYVGKKNSAVFTVDASSGRVLNAFGANSSTVYDKGICREPDRLESLDDDECGPVRTITLGRTDYTVGIHSTSGDMICTIKYFEWGPNNRDKDLASQYESTKDDRYIYSMYDGNIFALDHGSSISGNWISEQKPRYTRKFDYPVARVFDVVRPVQAASRDTRMVILPQPVANIARDGLSEWDRNQVYVNYLPSGSWYALSQEVYPMVTEGAEKAPCSRPDYFQQAPYVNTMNDPNYRRALVGVHSLSYSPQSPSNTFRIGGPDNVQTIEETPAATQSHFLPVPALPQGSFMMSWATTLNGFIFLAFCVFILRFRLHREINQRTKALEAKEKLVDVPTVSAHALKVDKTPLLDSDTAKTVHFFSNEANKEETSPERSDGALQRSLSQDLDDTVADNNDQEKEDSWQVLEKMESEETENAGEDTPQPKKNKAHRGKRGGRREREKKALKSNQNGFDATETDDNATASRGNVIVKPDVVDSSSKLGPGLGNLELFSDRILGTGSGGTLVFEGRWEDRDVAVKRMLVQHFELASSEISNLEQTEGHPNVIKYYCRREDQHFLYIALEKCQGSIWDLYRNGPGDPTIDLRFTPLAQEISAATRSVLRQLTEGLKYLHSSRIVHRDIKPHNMLIAYPRKNEIQPRIVISDFGLCKTLPDNVSTLIGTTANAGTAGWKAPELISHDISTTNGSTHSSNGDNLTGLPASAQGVKRAVDIFSLGCVFFYILTSGRHPFDDDDGWTDLRQRNIRHNRMNLSPISMQDPDTIDLIKWMLAPKPEDRPTASEVLHHPFFWNAEDRLNFLSTASDRFDGEERDPPSLTLRTLEAEAETVIGKGPTSVSFSGGNTLYSHAHTRSASGASVPINPVTTLGAPDFLSKIDGKFLDTLGRQRKYKPYSLADLLRALRNKHHHWDDMPDDVKRLVGEVPEGYLRYWERRFPGLVVGVWRVVRDVGIGEERRFWRWFGPFGGNEAREGSFG